jgi:hypothetical protein
VQEVAREGFEVIGCLHEPAQNRVGIGLEDPGHGTDTEALSQSGDGPHQLVGINLLAVKRRAVGLQEMPLAAETHQLPPAATIGMTVGADIAEADPAVVRTGGMRTEVATGIDLSATALGEEHAGWRCVGR